MSLNFDFYRLSPIPVLLRSTTRIIKTRYSGQSIYLQQVGPDTFPKTDCSQSATT